MSIPAALRRALASAVVLLLVVGLIGPPSAAAGPVAPSSDIASNEPSGTADEAAASPTVEPTRESASHPARSVAPAVEPSPTVVEPSGRASRHPRPAADPPADPQGGVDPAASDDAPSPSGEPIPAVAADQVELRARTSESDTGETFTTFDFNDPGNDGGTTAPLAGATFVVVLSETGEEIDSATTDQNGLTLLDAPVDRPFYLLDVDTSDASDDQLIDVDTVQQGRTVVVATRNVAAEPVPAPNTVRVTARIEQAALDDQDRTFFVVGGSVETGQVGDSQPGAGLTFRLISDDVDVLAEGTTDATGVVVLTAPYNTPFVVQEAATLDQSESLTLSMDDPRDGPLDVFATRTVELDSGPNTGPTGDILPYPIAEDFLTLVARFEQDPSNDGTAEYNDGVSANAANGDEAPAQGITFTVIDRNGLIVDQARTGPSGVVRLDVPVLFEDDPRGGDSYVLIDDYSGSPSQEFRSPTADEVRQGGRTVTVTINVDDLDDVVPSDTPSAEPSDTPSTEPSDGPSPSRSARASSSADASSDPTPTPSAGESAEDSALPSAIGSADASASPDASDAPGAGAQVTITTTVPLPDGAEVCLGDICQTLDASMLRQQAAVPFARRAAGGDVSAQAIIPAGTVIVFANVPPGAYTLTISFEGDLLYTETVTVVAGQPVRVVIDEGDQVDPSASVSGRPSAAASASATSGAAPSGGGSSASGTPSAGASDGGDAPAASAGTTGGTTALPNTGAGSPAPGSSMAWALFALLAVTGVGAAGVGLRRRGT